MNQHRQIPGQLDYEALARLHRPQDEQTLRIAAAELRARGLTLYDIGRALDLTESAVGVLLDEAPK